MSAKFTIYAPGDDDPTPVDGDCPARAGDRGSQWGCTWNAGHDHPQHVAGTGFDVAFAWFETEPPLALSTQISTALGSDDWLIVHNGNRLFQAFELDRDARKAAESETR